MVKEQKREEIDIYQINKEYTKLWEGYKVGLIIEIFNHQLVTFGLQ